MIGVLVSGEGSNLQALLDRELPVVAVASSRKGTRALARAEAARIPAHAFAHVTGGGIEGNLSRVLPPGLRAELDWDAWDRPPVFHWLGRHVAEEEARRVFNLGIGYCAVVPEAAATAEAVIGRIVRS